MNDLFFFAQAATESGSNGGGNLVLVVIIGVFAGLYFLNRSSQRKAEDAYRRRRAFEAELKANDPDLADDD